MNDIGSYDSNPINIKNKENNARTTEQISGESTGGYENNKNSTSKNNTSHTPFLTEAPPDFYESGLMLNSNSDVSDYIEANKRLLKSQYVRNSNESGLNCSNKEFRTMLRSQGSFSSYGSQSTISTKDGSAYDHVGALLNRGKNPKQSSYNKDEDDNDNDNDSTLDIYEEEESQSGTVKEIDHVHALLLRGSTTTNQIRPEDESETESEESDHEEITAPPTKKDEFEEMALQPPSTNHNLNHTSSEEDNNSDDDDDSDSDSELSKSDIKGLEKTPFALIQQKEEDMLSHKSNPIEEQNELFIGDSAAPTPKIRNMSERNLDKDALSPPPLPKDDDASSKVDSILSDNKTSAMKPAFEDDDSSSSSSEVNSFHPETNLTNKKDDIESNNIPKDDIVSTHSDEKESFIPKSKFEIDSDSDSDNESDCDTWKDEHSNRKPKEEDKAEDVALLAADFQKEEPEIKIDSFKSDVGDELKDIEIGKVEDKKEVIANISYNSDLGYDDSDSDSDEDLGVNVYDVDEKEENDTTKPKRNMKMILGVVCAIIILIGIIVTVVMATGGGEEEVEDIKPPEGDDKPTIMEPIILEGSLDFTNFGDIISSSSDGNRVAIVGTTNDTDSILILDATLSDDKISSFGHSGTINNTNASDILDVELSGDGNYLIMSASDMVQVYSKSSDAWVPNGDSTTLSTVSTSIPVDISYNGSIFAMSLPNYEVFVYHYTNNTWAQRGASITKPTSNSENFGNAIALSSNGNRIAISADGSNTVYLYEYNEPSNQYVNILTTPLSSEKDDKFGYSIGMNEDGDRIVVGSPNSDGYTDLASSGQCNVYDITSTQDGNITNYTAVPIGQALYGEKADDQFGFIVSLSKNGEKLAVSSPGDNTVRLYELSEEWVQIGSNFQNNGTSYGDVMSLSEDVLYIGSPSEGYGEAFVYDLVGLSDTSVS